MATQKQRQAARKNAVLPALQREKYAGFDVLKPFRQMEIDGATAAIGPAIDRALAQAHHVLADLDPALPGGTGAAQMAAMGSACIDA